VIFYYWLIDVLVSKVLSSFAPVVLVSVSYHQLKSDKRTIQKNGSATEACESPQPEMFAFLFSELLPLLSFLGLDLSEVIE
jgi:hypothetical protein